MIVDAISTAPDGTDVKLHAIADNNFWQPAEFIEWAEGKLSAYAHFVKTGQLSDHGYSTESPRIVIHSERELLPDESSHLRKLAADQVADGIPIFLTIGNAFDSEIPI